MYTITVSRSAQCQEGAVCSLVKDYEIEDGPPAVTFDDNHDVAIPLFHMTAVGIVRYE